ncbi:MAG: galactose-1-phosphate uridylyltransferase [candidate division Zixibacteria bacterium HGW-Zixibacteria-1]|nr:MAG: galactose-1-phosphate uridylyltransferase [candidate division Zixibacteria bacterium HGW-Zixibacteria-1]
MPEYRQNMATKEWVILSPGRGKRPSDFIKSAPARESAAPYEAKCPFCQGNEDLTLQPSYVYPVDGKWLVRVVPNKFAALDPDLDTHRTREGYFVSAHGFGIAEVVVEHPLHNPTIATMESDHIQHILRAYRERQIEISRNQKVNLVTIFRNHGPLAGTSLAHPHSQIIATPIVPPHVRYPMEQAVQYYDTTGHCVYCDMVKEELKQAERIIVETDYFVAFCPYAARSPFECRVYPKYHSASYMLINDSLIIELAGVLREVLARLYHGLKNPDHNYIIRSAPVGDEDTRHQHWYMVIIPKITTAAGFEIGSGIYINTISPEESAQYLREVKLTD